MALDDFTWDTQAEGSVILFDENASATTQEKDLINSEEDIQAQSQATTTTTKSDDELDEEEVKNNLFAEGSEDVTLFGEAKEKGTEDSNNGVTVKDKSKDKSEENSSEDDNSHLAVNKSSSKATLDFLSDKGLLHFDEEDEFEGDLDEDTASDLLELGLNKKVDATVKEMMGSLEDTTKEAVSFLLKGGDLNQLVSLLSKTTVKGISKGMDLESEDNQVLLAKHRLISLGEDEEDAETYIQSLKDSNKLAKYASKAYSEWEEDNNDIIAQENKAREEQRKKAIKDNAEYRKKVQDVVSKNEEYKGYKLTNSESKTIVDYLTKPTVQLADKKTVTGFQKDFMEAMKDPKKQVIIASLIKNDFDFSSIAKKQASSTSKNIKEELQRQKDNKVNNRSSGSSQPTGRLLDFLT